MSLLPIVIRAACLSAVIALAHAEGLTQAMPPQPLANALESFAKQAGLQLVYGPEVAQGVESPGASAGRSSQETLAELLHGTGLTFEFVNEHTVTIMPLKTAHTRSSEGTANRLTEASHIRLARDEPQEGGQSADAAPESPTSEPLEEITVTAQKRKERITDVPISISVLSGADLDKSTAEGVSEALNRVPGVATTVSYQGGSTQLTVRGVAAAGAVFFGSNPIAYYLDSVPFALVKSAIAPDSNAYDLERVEVLRGPQGTLYGASALNGVVRVLTHDADLNKFEFKGRTSASSTDGGGENYRGDLAVNVPLIDGKLAVRAVAGYQDLSGWIDKANRKDANDGQISNFRIKVNARPTEALSLGLSAWRSRTDGGAPSSSGDGERSAALIDEPFALDYDVYGFKLGYDFGAVSLSSATSYLDYANPSDINYIIFDLFTGFKSHVFSQEVNLNSARQGAWRWSLGGMFRKGQDSLLQLIPGGIFGPTVWRDQSKSTAVYGELTRYFLDDRLELTGGLRYFEDTVRSREGPPGVTLQDTEVKFNPVTSRAILSWHPRANTTVYGSYSEGFRSGFDQFLAAKTALPNLPALEPDTLKNYELGAKGSMLGGRLEYDTAVYFMDWQDVQQSLAVVNGNLVQAANVNGESASGIGVDFGVTAEPLNKLQLGLNFSWNNLTFDSGVVGFLPGSPPTAVVLFDKGDRLGSSPEYTVGASADYAFPIGGHGFEGSLSASANYISTQDFRTLSGALYHTVGDAMLISRASFAVRAPQRWTASLFVDNLSDERGTPIKAPYTFTDWSARVRPRTYGLQLEYKFSP